MTAISPTHAHAFWLLRNEIYTQLDEAEFVSAGFAESARKLIGDLVTVIRTVVAQHKEDQEGHCQFCHHTWPCLSIGSIHEIMQNPEREFAKLLHG
jgi:hypothetical protein